MAGNRETNYYPGLETKLSLSTTSAVTTNAVSVGIDTVRLVCSSAFYFVMGVAPVATTAAGVYVPANTVEYFKIKQGDKIAAILSASTATLNITECTQ